jgi:hypothetical protein
VNKAKAVDSRDLLALLIHLRSNHCSSLVATGKKTFTTSGSKAGMQVKAADGGHIVSDAGALLLGETDRVYQLLFSPKSNVTVAFARPTRRRRRVFPNM